MSEHESRGATSSSGRRGAASGPVTRRDARTERTLAVLALCLLPLLAYLGFVLFGITLGLVAVGRR